MRVRPVTPHNDTDLADGARARRRLRILILFASVGSGHQRAAEAVCEALRPLGDDVGEVSVVDTLQYTSAILRRTFAQAYLQLVRSIPELWSYIYGRADDPIVQRKTYLVRSVIEKINSRDLLRYARRFHPDAIVCTHFLPLTVLTQTRRAAARRPAPPLFAVLTDFAAHAFWVSPQAYRYYVATDPARRWLIRRGVGSGRISVMGIPLMPPFAQPLDRALARARLGLPAGRPLVVVMGGGTGYGSLEATVRSLREEMPEVVVFGLPGRNSKLAQRLLELRSAADPEGLQVPGFVHDMHTLLCAADLLVTKPGGVTCAEALACQLPMILTEPIPGHEERNSEFLLEGGAAVRLYDPLDSAHTVRTLLEHRPRIRRMRRRAALLARPAAAESIARDLLETLHDEGAPDSAARR